MSNDTLWEKLAVQEDQIKDLLADNEALREARRHDMAERLALRAENEALISLLREARDVIHASWLRDRIDASLPRAALSGRGE